MKRTLLLITVALLPAACKTAPPQLDINGQPIKKAPIQWSIPGFTFGLSYQGINAGITFPGRFSQPPASADLPLIDLTNSKQAVPIDTLPPLSALPD